MIRNGTYVPFLALLLASCGRRAEGPHSAGLSLMENLQKRVKQDRSSDPFESGAHNMI